MQINITDRTAVITGRKYQKGIGMLRHKSYKDLSDEELVKAFVVDKDDDAFNEIVNRYGDKIFGLALRVTHNPSDAEDVLQEVLVALVEKLYTFLEESKFSTWLYTVAANTSYMHIRTAKKKYENELSLEDYAPYNESGALEGVQIKDWSDRPDKVLLSHESLEMVEKAVNELPLPYRVVFHLKDVEGLTNQEVARVLGLTVSAAKSRILRARLFLRDKLSDYFYEWRNENKYLATTTQRHK